MSYFIDIKKNNHFFEKAENDVCDRYDVTVEDIYKRSRAPRNVQARYAVWYIVYAVYGVPVATIGAIYGYDHTTVIYGISRARELKIPEELGLQTVDKPVDKTKSRGDKV